MQRTHLLGFAVLVVGITNAAIARSGDCCRTTYEISGGDEIDGPCSGTTTMVCESGVAWDENGKRAGNPRIAECIIYIVNVGEFMRAPCDHNPGAGWKKLSGSLSDGQRCYAKTPVMQVEDRTFSIVSCEGARCSQIIAPR